MRTLWLREIKPPTTGVRTPWMILTQPVGGMCIGTYGSPGGGGLPTPEPLQLLVSAWDSLPQALLIISSFSQSGLSAYLSFQKGCWPPHLVCPPGILRITEDTDLAIVIDTQIAAAKTISKFVLNKEKSLVLETRGLHLRLL